MPAFTPVAVNEIPVPEQTDVWLEAIETVGIIFTLTINPIEFELAVVAERQVGIVPPAVTLAVMASPLAGIKLYVDPVVCETPFLSQVYVGVVPEFIPEAVNVTFPPEQTEVVFEVMATVGVKFPITVNPIEFELAVVAERHVGTVPPAVTLAVMASPLAGIKL